MRLFTDPELIRTNRRIVEQMHELSEDSKRRRQEALEVEYRKVAEAKAQSIEHLAQSERHAQMFRDSLNPFAAAMEAQTHIFASGVRP